MGEARREREGSVQVSTRYPVVIYEKLRRLADDGGMLVSEVVRDIVRRTFESDYPTVTPRRTEASDGKEEEGADGKTAKRSGRRTGRRGAGKKGSIFTPDTVV